MVKNFELYKVDMKYIRNLHNVDDKILSVSPQTGKDTRVFIGIVIIGTAILSFIMKPIYEKITNTVRKLWTVLGVWHHEYNMNKIKNIIR